MDYAQYRIKPCPVPITNRPTSTMRPCDVEVSSDDGKTWKTMPTMNTVWEGQEISITLMAMDWIE